MKKLKNINKLIAFTSLIASIGGASARHHNDLISRDIDGIKLYQRAQSLFEHSESPSEAVHYLSRSADLGNPNALYDLSYLYAPGGLMGENNALRLKYLQEAAERDHPIALGIVGMMYLKGDHVEKDEAKGSDYLKRAHAFDDPEINRYQGLIFLEGKYVEQDLDKAMDFFDRAIELGSSEAIADLGAYYEKEQRIKEAMECYMLSFARKNIGALTSMAKIMIQKNYVKPDDSFPDQKHAVKFLRHAINKGDAEAYYQLGQLHETGHLVKKSALMSKKNYRGAANLGHKGAKRKLRTQKVL